MKPKKNPEISLDRKRLIFFEIGMIVALAAVLLAFEWTSAFNSDNKLEENLLAEPEFFKDKIINTPRKTEKNREKPRLTLIINEVEDENIILEEPEFWNPESRGNESFSLKFIDYIDDPDFGNEDSIFIRVEEMPKFNNGDPEIEFRKYIASKLVFPREAIENGVDGRVTVTFVIDKQGNLTDLEIIDSPHPVLSEEAYRVISNSPRWTPGKQRTKPVLVRYFFPVSFKLK